MGAYKDYGDDLQPSPPERLPWLGRRPGIDVLPSEQNGSRVPRSNNAWSTACLNRWLALPHVAVLVGASRVDLLRLQPVGAQQAQVPAAKDLRVGNHKAVGAHGDLRTGSIVERDFDGNHWRCRRRAPSHT